jgi:hypothetical protein
MPKRLAALGCAGFAALVVISSAALSLPASFAAAQGLVTLEGSYIVPPDDPAIRYHEHGHRNAIIRMKQLMASGKLEIAYDQKFGYLPGLLKALDVPVSSQVLVFSKTSFQAARIYPHNPRAIYFNDSVAVGHVPGTDLLELTASDPEAGVVFYTLNQHNTGRPEIARQDECLQCHAIPRTLGVPGLVVRSVSPDRSGMPVFRAGSSFTDHRSPIEQRWGGWYVTGTSATHMGNRFAVDDGGTLEAAPETPVTNLTRFFDTSRHLTPHSDPAALMVLEHQVRMTNVITRVAWETRMALADHANRGKLLDEPVGTWSDSTRRRIERPAEVLLRSLLLVDEAPLTAPVAGTSSFAQEYSARGPRDRQKRSLYELDLTRRLYRYRCSPLIYSEQFTGLPREVRDYVYRRLVEVLKGSDRHADFAGMSEQERQTLLAILRETLPDLPM